MVSRLTIYRAAEGGGRRSCLTSLLWSHISHLSPSPFPSPFPSFPSLTCYMSGTDRDRGTGGGGGTPFAYPSLVPTPALAPSLPHPAPTPPPPSLPFPAPHHTPACLPRTPTGAQNARCGGHSFTFRMRARREHSGTAATPLLCAHARRGDIWVSCTPRAMRTDLPAPPSPLPACARLLAASSPLYTFAAPLPRTSATGLHCCAQGGHGGWTDISTRSFAAARALRATLYRVPPLRARHTPRARWLQNARLNGGQRRQNKRTVPCCAPHHTMTSLYISSSVRLGFVAAFLRARLLPRAFSISLSTWDYL